MTTETIAITKWALDPTHSDLGFKIKHLMITNVTGQFTKFDVSATSEEDDFNSLQITAAIDVASINTNNEQRDVHLRTGDFFESEKYPQILFKSTGVNKISDDELELRGDLTIKGITKPVKLTVEYSGIIKDPYGQSKAGFSFTTKIHRKDWGVNFNAALETGGVMLGEDVKINGEIQLVKQA